MIQCRNCGIIIENSSFRFRDTEYCIYCCPDSIKNSDASCNILLPKLNWSSRREADNYRNSYKKAKRFKEAEVMICFTCKKEFKNKPGKRVNCSEECSKIYEKNRYKREKGLI